MVYGAILEKGEKFYTDLSKVFKAIGEVQTEYNWLITDCICYPKSSDIDSLLSRESCWLSGDELASILNEENFQWILGVLSRFEKDIPLENVFKYPLPCAEGNRGFWKNPLTMQHPLAIVEIVPWDGALTLIFSKRKEIIDSFRDYFPLSEDLSSYNERMESGGSSSSKKEI